MMEPRPIQADLQIRYHYYECAMAPQTRVRGETPRVLQRRVTQAGLEIVQEHRKDFQVFNNLLVLYPDPTRDDILNLLPDNMVVLHTEKFGPLTSFKVPFLPVRPFWVMEYPSELHRRKDIKDYQQCFRRYEQHLQVPYYMIFYPDNAKLTLYRLNRERRYKAVVRNSEGRLAVSEVGVEVGVVDGRARFWHEGKLLPLETESARKLAEACSEIDRERRRADDAVARADRLAEKLRASGIDPEA